MRDLKTLYDILLKVYQSRMVNSDWVSNNFICHSIHHIEFSGKITEEEYQLLYAHFKTQRPSKSIHPEFTTHKLYNSFGSCYFAMYENEELGNQVRQELLIKIISTL